MQDETPAVFDLSRFASQYRGQRHAM